jgi:hypothetical protein
MAVARSNDPAYEYVDELEAMVRARYPEARFKVTGMPDSDEGVAVWTYTNANDEALRAIVRERELELLLEKDVYILIIAMPIEDWRD